MGSRARWMIVAVVVTGGLWLVVTTLYSDKDIPETNEGAGRNPVALHNDTPVPLETPTVPAGNTPTASETPVPSPTPASTDTPSASETPQPSNTPAPTEAPTPSDTNTPADADERDFEIVTLLPKDAIRAIFDPRFLSAEEANDWYDADELVLGVEINGDARAYSIPHLSRHEIVNDTVGGRKIAVTW